MKVPSRYWTLLRDSLSTTRFSDNSLRLTLLAIQTSIFYQAKGIFLYYTKQPKLETDSYLPTVSFRSVINEWMLRRSSANSWKKWRSVKLSFWASNTRSAGTNCLYYSTFPSPALSPTFVGNFKTKSMVLNDSFKISLLFVVTPKLGQKSSQTETNPKTWIEISSQVIFSQWVQADH